MNIPITTPADIKLAPPMRLVLENALALVQCDQALRALLASQELKPLDKLAAIGLMLALADDGIAPSEPLAFIYDDTIEAAAALAGISTRDIRRYLGRYPAGPA